MESGTNPGVLGISSGASTRVLSAHDRIADDPRQGIAQVTP